MAIALLPYNKNRPCPKCLEVGASTLYIDSWRYSCKSHEPVDDEHFDRTCTNCHYTWAERTWTDVIQEAVEEKVVEQGIDVSARLLIADTMAGLGGLSLNEKVDAILDALADDGWRVVRTVPCQLQCITEESELAHITEEAKP